MDDSSDNSNQTWLQDGLNSMQLKRSEMNELIMDYLVHEGFKEAAERFREEAGIEPANLRFLGGDQSQMSFESHNSNGSHNGANTNDNGSTNNGDDANNNLDQQQSHHRLGHHANNLSSSSDELMTDATLPITNQQPNQDDNNRFLPNLRGWPSKVETPDMLDKRIDVRHLIEVGDILKAQSLINLYYPELLDIHRDLYFKLQQQHLIELIRQQRINDVLSYVHDQLSVDELKDLNEMERTLALLAYEQPEKSPYSGLLQPSHRLQLASEINDTILQETIGNIEPTKPRLVTLLKLLFWTQNELERKKIQFPKMTDIVNGTIVEPRH